MYRWQLMTSLIGLLTILTAGCELRTEGGLNPVAPSELQAVLQGTWSSRAAAGGSNPSSVFPGAGSCSSLEWSITEQTGATYVGEFAATCLDGIQLAGTATGILIDDVLSIEASGIATLPGATTCTFTLTGTARLEGQAIRIDYTGNTCLGSISGSEILERR